MKFQIFFIVCAIFFFAETFSLPRFALLTNSKCSDCHYNPTGGIIRNERGFNYSKNILPMTTSKDATFDISQMIGENISLGLDYRTQYLAYFDSVKSRGDFQDMTASIYSNISISEKINVIARFDFLKSIYEGYGILNVLPNESYIKVGSFSPNFGIKLDDHTAYTRGGDFGLISNSGSNKQGLIFDPYQIHTGIEIGFNLPNELGLITFSAGKNGGGTLQKDPAYTTRIEVNPKINPNFNFMFGGSFLKFSDFSAGNLINKKIYGGFAGFSINKFTILAEYDLAKDYYMQDTTSSAVMIEASYEFIKGFQFVFRYDRFDRNTNVVKDDISHLIFGVEIFPYSFVEIRPQYRFALENPEIKNNAFVLQFHIWY